MNKNVLISAAIILLISLFTISPSFGLAFFGDDWLAFFRYAQHLGPNSPGVWNHWTYFLTPYGTQDILMGVFRKIYDFDSTPYYIISYLLRLVASFSFYPLILFLTKNQLATFYAVLFFSVTTIGLDSTNWVFNMPSYITIALFNLCLYFFLKARGERKPVSLIISAFFYYFAYVTTPIRMHGSLPLIFLIESFWIMQNRNLKTLKKSLIRLGVFLAVFLIIRFAGHSQGPPQEALERLNLGIQAMTALLAEWRFDFLFYPFVMFGSMIVPDILGPTGQINSLKQLLPIIIPTILIFFTFSYFILKNKVILLYLIAWTALVALIYKGNLIFFNSTNQIFSLLVGGYALTLIVFLLKSQALFLGVSWSFLSFFFAWWWVPLSIFPTTYRYLIVSSMGVTIILATIISLGKDTRKQVSLFVLLSILIFANLISTRMYLNRQLDSHGQSITTKIWSTIPYIAEIGKDKKPLIFYFEGDGTNGAILHDVITFGFPPHMALLYNLREEDPLPIPMSSWQEVVSAVSDGKTLPAYGYPPTPTTTDRIFAFVLQGKDNLIDVTDLARKKLQP